MATSRSGAAHEPIQVFHPRAQDGRACRPATFLLAVSVVVAWAVAGPAMQLKLDELIRATQGAHNALLDLEELEEDQLDRYKRSYEKLAARARERLRKGQLDTDSPDIKPSKS